MKVDWQIRAKKPEIHPIKKTGPRINMSTEPRLTFPITKRIKWKDEQQQQQKKI